MKNKYLVLFLSIFLLTYACNKNDDEPIEHETPIEEPLPDAPIGTAWQSSTINPNEIKGEDLTVLSSYYEEANVINNNFKTIVSQTGTQVVFVIDKNDSIVGLSYTLKKGDEYVLQEINAESTTIALFLLTPGISTTSPEETVDIINRLKSLTSYGKVKTLLKNNLDNKCITEIFSEENAHLLFEELFTDYLDQLANENQTKSASFDYYGTRVEITKNREDQIEISNKTFRHVNVYRSYIDDGKVTDSELIVENMGGGIGVSFGSIFTWSAFDPTIAIDIDYDPPTQSTVTEYWVIGPGKAESVEEPPSYINRDYNDAIASTCVYYILLPGIEMVNGVAKFADDDNLIKQLIDETKYVRVGEKGLRKIEKIKNAQTTTAIISSFIDFTFLIGKTAIEVPAIAAKLGISGGAAGAAKVLAALGSVMGTANFGFYMLDHKKQPEFLKFTIESPLDPPILSYPEDGASSISPSALLSWIKNPLADRYIIEVSEKEDFSEKIEELTNGITTSLAFNLNPSTKYYWRVYCADATKGSSEWSEVWSFTTGSGSTKPEISTLNASDITENSAILNGNVSSDGGASITERGFYWSKTNQNPNDNDNKETVAGTTGSYEFPLSRLTPSTTYYYRAYAKNSQGHSVADNVESFTTKEEQQTDLESGTFVDERDGHEYKWVKIGDQIWMAENLAYLPQISSKENTSITVPYYYVYGYNGTSVSSAKQSENYKNYGVLYNYTAAKNSCPTGWHLPSRNEWEELAVFIKNNTPNYVTPNDGWYDVGKQLKSTSGWAWNTSKNISGNGTDDFGFNGKPGGLIMSSDNGYDFVSKEISGYWWAPYDDYYYTDGCVELNIYGTVIELYDISRKAGLSIRCVKD